MSSHYRLDPAFINGSQGALFSMHYTPLSASDTCVIGVPSFAEEMNRCRYMQTMLAQQLCEKNNTGLLCVDPFGTGDSAGNFNEGGWEQWVDDTVTAYHYAKHLGYTNICLLGVRFGALLALAATEKLLGTEETPSRLVFWQPIINGHSAFTQFLRIKIAASIGRDEEAGNTADLEAQMLEGKVIEVAGYFVSKDIFTGIRDAAITNHLSITNVPIDWYTVLASEERKTPRGDSKVIDKWMENGATINHHKVIGPAFWQAHERTLVPSLVTDTVNHLQVTTTEDAVNEQ